MNLWSVVWYTRYYRIQNAHSECRRKLKAATGEACQMLDEKETANAEALAKYKAIEKALQEGDTGIA